MTSEKNESSIMLSVGLLPMEPYPGARVGWKSRCLKCDALVAPHFSTITQAIKKGISRGCASCGAAKGQQTRREAYYRNLPGLLAARNFAVSGSYWNAKTPTAFRCLTCDQETLCTSDSIISGKRACSCQKLPRKSLARFFPELASELLNEMNGELTGERIGTGMRSSVWWKCPSQGHVYDASPANRVRGSGCRYCSGNEPYPGETDLASSHPELCQELAAEQPDGISAQTLKSGSSVKANWICKKNRKHVYPASPYERISSQSGCSYCAGKRVLLGDNDLNSTHPEVASEWDYEANFPQRPEWFTAGSNKEFQWRCGWNPNHVWRAKIITRTKGHGCNQCSRVKTGRNDLRTMAELDPSRQHLIQEWDSTGNEKTPSEVAYADNSEYWWLCGKGLHPRYLAKCSNRWFSLSGCPTCAPSAYSTSKPGRLYFLNNEGLGSFKIGITNLSTKTDRLKKFAGHGWATEHKVEHESGLLIKQLERRLLFIIREIWELPPHLGSLEMRNMGGATETFTRDRATVDEIKTLIDYEFQELVAGFKR